MARDHARTKLSIWNDPDFRSLTIAGQHMYWTLCAQQKLSYCGVMDWWPNRLAQLAEDATEDHVWQAIEYLMDRRYVFLDLDTSELLIRTYVRHDGVMQRANMGKATGRALDQVTSLTLQEIVFEELAKMHRSDPSMGGWVGLKELFPAKYERVISMALAMGSE